MSTVTQSNNPPVAGVPIEDQHFDIGTDFSFTIPEDAFTDPDGDTLTYIAWRLEYAGDVPLLQILPTWLEFNPDTGVFSLKEGETASTAGALDILIWAFDGDFAYAQQTFTLSFGPADDPVEPQKLIASDGGGGDVFGANTHINDLGVFVVSALGDDDKGFSAGAVYVYTPDEGGYQETKLVASDGDRLDHFGFSSAINSSGLVVVGARWDDDNGGASGSVYVYTPTEGGGYSETKLLASDGAEGDQFGSQVHVTDAGVIVVGASGLGYESDPGAVYVYTPDGQGGYTEVKLTASDETPGNYFGFATDINENGVIFVGASNWGGGAAAAGTAYVYTPDGSGGYTETKLLSPDLQGADFFGHSGAINADGTIVIGAMEYDAEGTGSGAFYVYQPDGSGNYTIKKIQPSELGAGDQLGRSLDINDAGVIVVGADGDDRAENDNEGAAYVFVPDGNGGYTEFKLTAYDAAAGDQFGYSVSVNNDGVITVGSYLDDDNGTNSGSVYTFVPDEHGNYVGPDGTVYTEYGEPEIYSYGESFEASGDPAAAKLVASSSETDDVVGGRTTHINDLGVFVVSALGDDDKGFSAGAVYVYTPDEGGYQETKLVASDGDRLDHFGFSSAINSSGLVVVGARWDDDNGGASGSVYVYTPTEGGGYSETKLLASDGAEGDQFGSQVHVTDAGVIVVGASGLGYESDPGAVYVYTPDGQGGYTEVKLTASDETPGNYFGHATDINENGVIFVGASSYGDGAAAAGTAYVYTPDGSGGYTETKLLSPDLQGADFFGHSGAINADGTIVIGAMEYDAEGTGSGAFYVYQPDGSGNYTIKKIQPSELGAGDQLGRSLDINDAGVIVVGADGDDRAENDNEGAAYVFVPDGNGGYTEFKLTAYDAAAGDQFGYSVSVNNDGVVTIGAYGDDDNGSNTGAVYTFVPDEHGNYVGPDGTVYTEYGEPEIYSYGESFEASGDPAAAKLVASSSETDDVVGGRTTHINDLGVFVVSALGDDDKGFSAGAVYVYTPDEGGYQETKLVASDGDRLDHFGFSSAINSSGLVVVGARWDDDNGGASGSVYVYTPTEGGGYSETKLLASDGAEGDQFGSQVHVTDAGVIVVGASGLGYESDPGAVYVYTPDGQGGYTEVKLTASDETPGNYFGHATDINENGVIFVGASSYGDGAAAAGTAYVYTPDGSGGYTETKLLSPDLQGADFFGHSGAINADGTIVIGAMEYDAEGTGSGAFYVYQPDGSGNYTIKKIQPSELGAGDQLGRSLDINDAGVIVVGADGDDRAENDNEGAAYVFVPDGNGGYTEFKLTAYDAAARDQFGYSVSVNNDGVVTIGAYGDDDNGSNTGAVYTFVPDEHGNYVGADGTVYEPSSDSSSQKIFGTDAANVLVGSASADEIDGAGGGDEIEGGGGSDVMTGGSGSDTFVFNFGDTGHDTVTDFTAGAGSEDVMEFDSALFATYDALLAAMTDDGTDTTITIDAETTITVEGVTVADLHQDDFNFV